MLIGYIHGLCSVGYDFALFWTELSCFHADASSKGIPLINEVGNDDALIFLRAVPLSFETISNTSLNSRIKRCIGDSLKTQRDSSQKNEGVVIANLINKWNSFGKCICVKSG